MIDIFKEKERRGNINSSFNMKILYNYSTRLNYWIHIKRVSRQLGWSTVADSVLAKRKKAPLRQSVKRDRKKEVGISLDKSQKGHLSPVGS